MSAVMCRVCLTENLGMHFIRNTQLQEVYEKLSKNKLIVEDGRPETVCYTCCLQLQRCHDFSIMSQKADNILTQFYRDGIEISSDIVAALHKTLNSLDSMKTVSPEYSSTHEVISPLNNDQPLEGCPVQFSVTVKQEPFPLKVELIDNIQNYITEEIKIEVTPENNEQDNTEYGMPCFVGPLLKPETKKQMKEDKHTKPFQKYACNKSLSNTLGKPYTCDICNKTFTLKSNLKAHTKIHLGEKLSACDTCGKKFPNGYRLKRHMKSHTGEKPFACDQCDKTFPDRSHLKNHIMIHTGEKSYICTVCNAPFNLNGNLRRHMRSHTGEMPFLCDICKKSLPDASSLSRHMRIHTGEKPYKCSECGKAYSDKDNYKRHMRLHTGEKPYACKLCDYKSANGSCLKTHIASKHCKPVRIVM